MIHQPNSESGTVAGIDLAAGSGTTVAVALSFAKEEWPPLSLIRQQIAASDDDLLDFVHAMSPCVVAIDAPLTLPASVMSALADKAALPGSAYTRAAERDQVWQTLGVRPFPVSFLGGLTFRAIIVAQRMRQRCPEMRIIEAFPSATFAVLGLRPQVSPPARRLRKSTPEARQHIQQGLRSYVDGLPAPGDLLMSVDTLDAIGAGLAAYAFVTGHHMAIGDSGEGQIILPGPGLLPPTR